MMNVVGTIGSAIGMAGSAMNIANSASRLIGTFSGANAPPIPPVWLTLGNVIFYGFELPETIKWGGEQTLTIHKFAGGIRVIDAMGRDDADLSWSGRFRGKNAVNRARLLDQVRISGSLISLAWDQFVYEVIVKSFTADYSSAGLEIPYSLSLIIVADLSRPVDVAAAMQPDAQFDADLKSASSLASGLGLSSLISGLSAVSSAFELYRRAKAMLAGSGGSPMALLAGVQSALSGAQSVANGIMGALDKSFPGGELLGNFPSVSAVISSASDSVSSAVKTIGDAVPGLSQVQSYASSVQSYASSLINSADAMQVQSQLVQVSGLLGRMGGNLQQMKVRL